MKLAIPLISLSVLAASVAAAVWFPSSVVLTTDLLPAAGEPIPSAAPVEAKSSQRESGLKIDNELTSVAAAFKDGQIFLDDKAKQAIDRVIPAAWVASLVRVHGIEPARPGNALAAKQRESDEHDGQQHDPDAEHLWQQLPERQHCSISLGRGQWGGCLEHG